MLWAALEARAGLKHSVYCLEDYPRTPDYGEREGGGDRADEIGDVVRTLMKDPRYKLEGWVILDDGDVASSGSTENLAVVQPHFVRTKMQNGLTSKDADLAVDILLSGTN